jgi:hypothetical protein
MEKQATKRSGRETRAGLTARPEHEHIALLAYALWQERGCPEGSPEVDWFRAEQEFATRRAIPLRSMTVVDNTHESNGRSDT